MTSSSSSEKYLEKEVPEATIVPVKARTDCLVALQEGRADAVLLPYSILFGLWEQDHDDRDPPDKPPQAPVLRDRDRSRSGRPRAVRQRPPRPVA